MERSWSLHLAPLAPFLGIKGISLSADSDKGDAAPLTPASL
ncbi:MAG: hypothetical protein SOT68_06505 [Oscillospiraceae bacterium]|nr:hypothetical protein [Oscillospiraceae bacterium]